MCGILGVVSFQKAISDQSLKEMRDMLEHRGPDSAGIWRSEDRKVSLAHRRLSVIDLSDEASQPMEDSDQRAVIIFNGEIYNFQEIRKELRCNGVRFRTNSDTEVILEAWKRWGEDCLARLRGMFAFAIYDQIERKLFLARDRAGEKPLFYYHRNGRLLFASELKALIASNEFAPELNREAFQYYLTYGYVPGEHCMLKGFNKLPAAHYICYDVNADDIRSHRYWSLPDPENGYVRSAAELADEFLTLLDDAVRQQLVADVPVGVLLSGGLDSSLITASASKVSSGPVKTFTIAFPGYGKYNEGPHAKIVANHFGTEHTELMAQSASVELLPILAKQYDEPIADSSMVPTYLVTKLIREHAKVALGGDGGDELFGGYPHYCWLQRFDCWREILPQWFRNMLSKGAMALPVGFRGRNHIAALSEDTEASIAHVNLYFDAEYRSELLCSSLLTDVFARGRPEEIQRNIANPLSTTCRRAMETDFKTTMVDAYLVKIDRASMLNSLELRSPFLDHKIIEFAFAKVPDNMKATKTERKILLRHVAKKSLPSDLDIKRKQGLAIPLSAWFGGAWGDFMKDVLYEASDLYNQRFISSMIQKQAQGYSNTQRLFALVMFELWRREYKVSL